ncbi:hypothetical protein [Ramlibacter sp.]|uniref:hypothetical protein n=1 Tax=Ramlibacter sp. TaxID=1917967 RepID=UPI003D151580
MDILAVARQHQDAWPGSDILLFVGLGSTRQIFVGHLTARRHRSSSETIGCALRGVGGHGDSDSIGPIENNQTFFGAGSARAVTGFWEVPRRCHVDTF